jgi:hypothetical protein
MRRCGRLPATVFVLSSFLGMVLANVVSPKVFLELGKYDYVPNSLGNSRNKGSEVYRERC